MDPITLEPWAFAILSTNAALTICVLLFLVWFNREIDNDRKD